MKGRLDKLARAYPGATERCAGGIGLQVIKDALNETPRAPLDTGTLRASGTFEVYGGMHWRYAKVMAGFNTNYAARVHQVPMNFNTTRMPGAGNYFLSTKLQRHARDYIVSWTNCVAHNLGMA